MTDRPPRPNLPDLVYSWIQSNPKQAAYAAAMAAEEAEQEFGLLADWLTSLLQKGQSCWPYPPLRFAELMSLSTLRRELGGSTTSHQDILTLGAWLRGPTGGHSHV